MALVALITCVVYAKSRLDISTDQNDLFSHKVGFFRNYLDFIDKFPENEAIYVIVRPVNHPDESSGDQSKLPTVGNLCR